MGKSKDTAKTVRRAVARQAAAVQEQVAVDIIMRLYSLPLWERLKWATKIVRGLPVKEPLWSWLLSIFKRLGIEIAYRAKRVWARLHPAKVEVKPGLHANIPDEKFAWQKDEKSAETKQQKS